MTEPRLACEACGREIDCCAFCDNERCTSLVCYRCVLYQLREALPVWPRGGDED